MNAFTSTTARDLTSGYLSVSKHPMSALCEVVEALSVVVCRFYISTFQHNLKINIWKRVPAFYVASGNALVQNLTNVSKRKVVRLLMNVSNQDIL